MAGEGKFIDNLINGNVFVGGAVRGDSFNKLLIEDFKSSPVMSAALGSAATATSASVMRIGNNTFLTTPIIGQTLIAPVLAATGLDVAGDQTDNDGREIDFSGAGVLGARSLYSYTVGQKAFYGKLTLSLADVSGTDLCMFGFRKAAAHNADATAYTDFATLNVVSADIKISTNLNAAGITTTDTTLNWADGETHTLEVRVAISGAATFYIDGVQSTVATVTLDATDVMIPFFSFLQATDLCNTMIFKYLEVGVQ